MSYSLDTAGVLAPAYADINKGVQQAVAASQQGYNEAAGAAAQSNATSSAALNPFISAGTDAYYAYLDAIGIPRMTTPASPGTAAVPLSLSGGNHLTRNGVTYQLSQEGVNDLYNNGSTNVGTDRQPNILYLNEFGRNPGGGVTPQFLASATSAATKNWSNFTPLQKQSAGGSLQAYINSLTGSIFSGGTPATPGTPAQYTTPDANSILSRFMNSPGYQAMYQQGLSALNSAASAQGLLGSGAQGQALEKFGANYAQTGYQNYLNNLLQGAQPGLTAAGTLSTNATSAGNALQGSATAAGNTQAQAQLTGGLDAAKLSAETARYPGAVYGPLAESFNGQPF